MVKDQADHARPVLKSKRAGAFTASATTSLFLRGKQSTTEPTARAHGHTAAWVGNEGLPQSLRLDALSRVCLLLCVSPLWLPLSY